jgi:hypothetical protein
LSLAGSLPSNGSLQWVQLSESIGWRTLLQLAWQAAIALLYLGWLAAWWTKRNQPNAIPGKMFPGNGNGL